MSMTRPIMLLFIFTQLCSYNVGVAVQLGYVPMPVKQEVAVPLFKAPSSQCASRSISGNICIDSFPQKEDNFMCHTSQFECLLSEDVSCVSMPTTSCSQQHCIDGSDSAFCHLKSSFWQLGNIPTEVRNASEPYLELRLLPMPLTIRRWLAINNVTLGFTFQVYKTLGPHVTTLVLSTAIAAYPTGGDAISSTTTPRLLPGPIVRRLGPFAGYAAVVDLYAGRRQVAPGLTRRFAVALTPPRLLAQAVSEHLGGGYVFGVGGGGPDFSVDLDSRRGGGGGGVNATTDGGLQVEWSVPAAWSTAYPPAAYNFSLAYWPDFLCGIGPTVVSGLVATRYRLAPSQLNPATRYWLTVRACNRQGCGPRSDDVTGVTLGPRVPSVDLVSADLSNGTDLTVTWALGASHGWPAGKFWRVSLYYDTNPFNLICSDRLALDASVATSLGAGVRLDHLQGCSLYAMRVQVTDPAGYGPASQIYLQATGLSSTSPPKNVQYIYPYRGNATQALVVWNAPCIIVFKPVAYVLQVTDLFTQETRAFYVDRTADSVISQPIGELELGRPYRLMVFTNVVGGKSSVPVVMETDAFVGVSGLTASAESGAPATPAVSGSDCSRVTVRWSAGDPQLLAISVPKFKVQYEVFVTRIGPNATTKRTKSASPSTRRIWHLAKTGHPAARLCLKRGAAYEIRVRALLLSLRLPLHQRPPLAPSAAADKAAAAVVVAGAFSRPVTLDLTTTSRVGGPSNVVEVAGIAAFAVCLAAAALIGGWLGGAARRRRRRHRLLVAGVEGACDSTATLFPEYAGTR